jgi:divalent metal cation (Fe/Co/Zn/Cd) transporter
VTSLRLRWSGHALRGATDVIVDGDLSLVDAHRIAEEAEHRLIHEIPRLTGVVVHTDPSGYEHSEVGHHR